MNEKLEKKCNFNIGDTIVVHQKIKEAKKERIQLFKGIVIAKHENGISSTFMVRKVSFGIGVEKIFPLYSPNIEKIEVVTRGDVRRAKLYYLRNLKGKAAKVATKKEYI